MIKTFSFGILLGIALTALLIYFVPAVDQHREPSIISVQANGGNTESFHVNLPDARIVFGAPGSVNRCRMTSALWHIMSLSTPPPCSAPCQNHGMWGPLCSSAARAR